MPYANHILSYNVPKFSQRGFSSRLAKTDLVLKKKKKAQKIFICTFLSVLCIFFRKQKEEIKVTLGQLNDIENTYQIQEKHIFSNTDFISFVPVP